VAHGGGKYDGGFWGGGYGGSSVTDRRGGGYNDRGREGRKM